MITRSQPECPTPMGTLLIIGGKENKGEHKDANSSEGYLSKEEILKQFISLTRKENPAIEVITSASAEGDESFEEYRKVFTSLGAASVGHLHHRSRREITAEESAKRISDADAFFFAGGNQLLLTSLYGGTDFLCHIKERYIHEQVVIAGTSAGAMAMSTTMIYAGNKEVEQLAGEIKVTTGLEFVKDVCIDTHFVSRGRFVRMAQVIATNPSIIGIGIEEDTAIILRNGQDAEVVGSGIIIIIEGFELSEANIRDFTEKKPVSIRDLRVHLLSCGNKYTIPLVNPSHR